jgi:hypothetical protein
MPAADIHRSPKGHFRLPISGKQPCYQSRECNEKRWGAIFINTIKNRPKSPVHLIYVLWHRTDSLISVVIDGHSMTNIKFFMPGIIRRNDASVAHDEAFVRMILSFLYKYGPVFAFLHLAEEIPEPGSTGKIRLYHPPP